MKKLIKLIPLLLVLALILASCVGKNGDSSAQVTDGAEEKNSVEPKITDPGGMDISDERLNVILPAEPSAIYPQYAGAHNDSGPQNVMYDSLIKYDSGTGKASPHLAKSWEWIDDTHIRFILRDDIYFHDGSKLTANDVHYTFEVGLKYNNKSAYDRIFDIDNFVVEDDHSIIFALNLPYPTLFSRLGLPLYGIISESAIDELGGEEVAVRGGPIGTGKYKFVSWTDGTSMLLERNEDYWDSENLPYFKEINFTFISDAASRAMSIESGDADIAEINITQVAGLQDIDRIIVDVFEAPGVNTFFMNCSLEPFNNALVREAIYNLIDPLGVRDSGCAGFGTISETNFSPISHLYSSSGNEREVDIAKAKQLLEEAGYEDGFSFSCVAAATTKSMCEAVQAMLLEGNIDMKIDVMEYGTFINTLFSGEYEAYVRAAETYDPVISINNVDGRVGTNAPVGGAQYHDDDTLFSLVDTALAEYDPQKSIEAYAAIQKHVYNNYINVGICTASRAICYNSELTGVTVDGRGYPDYSTLRPTK